MPLHQASASTNETNSFARAVVPTAVGDPAAVAPPRPTRTEERTKPGLLVLSLSGRILYVNEPACRYLNGGHGKDGDVLPAITELVDHLITALVSRHTDTGLAQLEAKRLIRGHEADILLQVFGIGSRLQSRVVVTIRVLTAALHKPQGEGL